MIIVLVLLGCYLLASIPFGLVITRMMGLGDLRQIGSGNIGTSNVLRTGSKTAAALTLIFDAVKGGLAVYITAQFTENPVIISIAAVISVIGHCYPIWLKFQGGKGVATGIGVVIILNPISGIAMIGVWLAAAAWTRLSSASAMIAYITTPILIYNFAATDEKAPFTAGLAIIAVIVIWRHRSNITRILNNTEPRIGKST